MSDSATSPSRKRSASSDTDDDHNDATTTTTTRRPASKRNPISQQANTIERLMNKVDKPIEIPSGEGRHQRGRAPKEFVMNVMGSSAGAGSGDFHVYRALRRKEYARMKSIQEEAKLEKEELEYAARMAKVRQAEEQETAKKRAKRQKRKLNVRSKELLKKPTKEQDGVESADERVEDQPDSGDAAEAEGRE
ncbi:hypothetical protein SeMB42_g04774 [Synchytrium endobioticum]|uniref:DUF1168 domain-containing protein n=1 Tax=Synchytrium endobioticum TaxID=286115 RepID=A0A507CVX7_9FUNG|nr:hypothetical protein SeMB42_g04774 [Synchytrium endobioticum]TPX46184.1 hypothetical protein SeLEV6574_g03353 [Synchytrium endobioticum]